MENLVMELPHHNVQDVENFLVSTDSFLEVHACMWGDEPEPAYHVIVVPAGAHVEVIRDDPPAEGSENEHQRHPTPPLVDLTHDP